MALTCGFYNSVDGDRKYDATQFASLFDGVITDGVVAAVGDFFATTPGGGMTVDVGSGRAWFNRTWTYSDAKIPLSLEESDLLYDRIDAIVLEIDTNVAVRDNSIKVLKGNPAQEPVKPVLINEGDIHQYALAYIRVKASSIEIGSEDITINVGQTDCPFVTSIVETPELDVLFARWDAEFTKWFENVQSQLEGDIAANLQRQIDANWQNTLKYETKKLYGLNDDAIPDDVFKIVANYDTFEVGDIIRTSRIPTDGKWALCNGASISRDEYPELEGVLSQNPSGSYTSNTLWTDSTFANPCAKVSSITKAYIFIVCSGSINTGGYSGNEKPAFAFATISNPTSWTIKTDAVSSYGSYSELKSIVHFKGNYFGIGYEENSSGIPIPYVIFSMSLAGSWSKNNISTTLNNYFGKAGFTDLIEVDGRLLGFWFAAYQSTTLITAWNSSSEPNWSSNEKTFPNLLAIHGAVYRNGKYILYGRNSTSNKGFIYFCSDPTTDDWVRKDFDEEILAIEYIDGYYIAVGTSSLYRFTELTSSSSVFITSGFSSSNLVNILVSVDTVIFVYENRTIKYIKRSALASDYYTSFFISSSVTPTQSELTLTSSSFIEDTILLGAHSKWVSPSNRSAVVSYKNLGDTLTLPSISSSENTYWFMKIKSEVE